MPKVLGGVLFLGSEMSQKYQTDELLPLAGFEPPGGLHSGSWPWRGVW